MTHFDRLLAIYERVRNRKPQHDCPACVCGLWEFFYSDREDHLDLSDGEAVALRILHWAADHSYDRGTYLPLPEAMRDAAWPVIERHLSAVDPNWADNSVSLARLDQEAFFYDLLKAITPHLSP